MIKGIDISNHNGNIDFGAVRNDGVEFIYIKATEGTTFQDPLLNQHYVGAIDKGFKLGFYHYLKGTSQPETQAENFYNQIKDKENQLKPCLDIEENNFDVMDYALRFIARFKQLSNMDICIYAGPYFINDNLDNRLDSYPLWVAHYGVDNPMDNNVWGSNYSGHQYTDTGRVSGIDGNVDMNNFTSDILLSGQPTIVNLNTNTATTVQKNEYEEHGVATVCVDKLNVRTEPNTNAEIVACYRRGEHFTYDYVVINDGYVWTRYIGGSSGQYRYVAVRVLSDNTRYANCY